MRNLWSSSPVRRLPALVLFCLPAATVAACNAPDTAIDDPLGQGRAALDPDGGGTCSPDGNGCMLASECCTGQCTDGVCGTTACLPDGLVGCMLPSQCCTGQCFGGVCGQSSCLPDGPAGCMLPSQCCSGECNGGFCGVPVGPTGPIGFWHFDDCAASSAVLVDSSGFGNTANRTASAACVPGISGLAVDFEKAKDSVTVADGASFAFTNHIAVAAWIKPSVVTGTHAIVEQQFGGNTTFALSVVKGSVQFSIALQNGKTVKSTAPISADVWSHVAGSYDGQFIFLYLDGQQVGQVDVPSLINEANGPIEIGNNAAKQQFGGIIDDVWISTGPVTLSDIQQLTCIHRPMSFVATPAAGPPSAPGTAVSYQVVVTDNDAGFCNQEAQFFFSPQAPQGFTVFAPQNFSQPVPPGGSATFPFTVTSSEDADPGIFPIPFFIQDFADGEFVQGQVTYDVLAQTGCFVSTNRELMIKDLSVVEDPVRTTWNGPLSDPRTGAWTFGNLMQNLAPTPAQAPAMVQALVNTWLTDQQVGGFTVQARPFIQQLVIDPWPRTMTGDLDLTRAPLRLSAIVNRMDVRNLNQGKAGEGRFVFSVLDPNGFPLQFTLIVEYALPATTDADVLTWANAWHDLGTHPFPSEEYNAALQALTARFIGNGAAPGNPNGSALAQLRTNEIALSFQWELREFHLSPTTGFLQQAGVALTPDLSLNQTPTLADFVNQNQATILTQQHTVPGTFEGQSFQGGSSLNPLIVWSAPGIADNDARQLFSLNTCNGCHGPETGTNFLHIAPRFPGQEAQLSGFLTGITVGDPITGQPRTFGDLAARNADLTALVCTPPAPAGSKAAKKQSALIKTGRRQVH
jgi:hypothetical protein